MNTLLDELLEAFTQAVREGNFIQLVLSRPRDAAMADLRRVTVRPVLIKSQPHLQFAYSHRDQETHRNLTLEAARSEIARWADSALTDAHLFTTTADFTARFRAGSPASLKRPPPSKSQAGAATQHDRPKQYHIPDGIPCPFLIAIGVMTAEGRVRAAKYHKFRQINRFLELVDDVISELPEQGELRVVDFGCGKSYLTFALHHLLTTIHRRQVEIVGLDLKRDVVAHCQQIAESLGCGGLSFQVGDIAQHEARERIDLTVSLHACDTATDWALAKAVTWNSQVILSVPCCQHELASAMTPDLLRPAQRHGILRERLAAIATDALRAQALEVLGYRTQILEFIDLEHTAKNLLIRAVRRPLNREQHDNVLHEYLEFKRELGLGAITLERALAERWALAASPGQEPINR